MYAYVVVSARGHIYRPAVYVTEGDGDGDLFVFFLIDSI